MAARRKSQSRKTKARSTRRASSARQGRVPVAKMPSYELLLLAGIVFMATGIVSLTYSGQSSIQGQFTQVATCTGEIIALSGSYNPNSGVAQIKIEDRTLAPTFGEKKGTLYSLSPDGSVRKHFGSFNFAENTGVIEWYFNTDLQEEKFVIEQMTTGQTCIYQDTIATSSFAIVYE